MDINNIAPDNNPEQVTLESSSDSQQNGYFLPIIGVIVLVLVVGAGAYYLSTRKSNNSADPASTITPPAGNFSSPTPPQPDNKQAQLPADWTLKKDPSCAVSFPLPPKKEPYYFPFDESVTHNPTKDEGSGRFWYYQSYGNGGMFLFKNDAGVILLNPDQAGSGFLPASIQVMCSSNTARYNTSSLVSALEQELGKEETSLKIASKNTVNLWGHEVIVAKIEGGMFTDDLNYLFATDKNIYLVRKIVMSETSIVKETAEQIFNNLVFED